MRKTLLSASLLVISLLAQAQEADSSEGYKPVQGDVTAEFTYGGLFNDNQLGLNGGGLRFRYFLSDGLAGRLGLNVSSNSKTYNFLDASRSGDPVVGGTEKNTNSLFDINLGIEKHFSGTERLSTYAGADLRLNLASAKIVGENVAFGSGFDNDASYTIKGGSTGFGLRLVGGADYYFVKKVYLGGEFGWGFLASRARDTKSTFKNGTISDSSTTPPSGNGENEEAKAFDLQPSVVGTIRLGFRF